RAQYICKSVECLPFVFSVFEKVIGERPNLNGSCRRGLTFRFFNGKGRALGKHPPLDLCFLRHCVLDLLPQGAAKNDLYSISSYPVRLELSRFAFCNPSPRSDRGIRMIKPDHVGRCVRLCVQYICKTGQGHVSLRRAAIIAFGNTVPPQEFLEFAG